MQNPWEIIGLYFLSGHDKNEYPSGCFVPGNGPSISVLLFCSIGVVLVRGDLSFRSRVAKSNSCFC